MLQEAVFTLLTTHATLGPLLATGTGEYRVYPANVPQEVYTSPSVVYKLQLDEAQHSKSGASTLDVRYLHLICIADTYNEVLDLALQVRAAMDYARGTYAAELITGIHLEDETEFFDEDIHKHYIEQRYKLRHNR